MRGDVPANLDEHVRLARLAAAEDAQVVVFPELSLTGYELDLAEQLAFSENDPRLSPLLDLASTHEMILIVGAPVRVGPLLHIGAFVLGPDRSTRLYTKRRLGAFPASAACDSLDGSVPPAEATVFQPGDHDPLVRFGGGTAAIAVCADIGDPGHPQRAANRGADAYLASMFVIPSDYDGEVAKLSGYAVRHRMLTALANFGGPSGGLRSAGCSAIWSETGERLVQLDANGSGVAVVTETPQGYRTRTVVVAAPDRQRVDVFQLYLFHGRRLSYRRQVIFVFGHRGALQMAKRGVAAEMRKHAKAAAEMVFAEYGHTMDFSEPTIGAVEAILNGFWKAGDLSDDLAANITLLFGSYIGELIREAFPDAKWDRGESTPESAGSPYIQLDDIKLFPITWCYKRLYNGPDDSVVKKYLAFRDVVDSRSE